MSTTLNTTNMGLVLPVPGEEPGPDYANLNNGAFSAIDAHDHSQGSGVAISPAGLNINSDLAFGTNNATLLRSVRFFAQASTLALASDLACLYVVGTATKELYYNDASGNSVQITNNGSVNGATGNITNLVAGAAVTYSSGTATFIFTSAANTPALLDGASFILRNLTASSKGLTLAPPSAMSADYTITLPAKPAVNALVSMNSSGAMATTVPDGVTLVNTSGTIGVPNGGIAPAQIVAGFGLIPSGVILGFGGASAPTGYLLCDGNSYLRSAYPDLFSAIGTAYGAPDSTHFRVPDSRGLFMRFVDGGSTNDPDANTRTAMNAGGNTGNNVGSVQADQVGPITISMSGGAVGSGTTGSPQHVVQSDASGLTMNATPTGTSETRPRNFYATAIIKT